MSPGEIRSSTPGKNRNSQKSEVAFLDSEHKRIGQATPAVTAASSIIDLIPNPECPIHHIMTLAEMEPQKTKKEKALNVVLGIVISQVLCCGAWLTWPFNYTPKTVSKQYVCISDLKQITLAAIMYADDNNDSFPSHFTLDGHASGSQFMADVMPYCKNELLFHCPFDTNIYGDQLDIYGDRVDANEKIQSDMTYVHCTTLKRVIPNFDYGMRILKPSTIPNPENVSYLRDPIRGTKLGIPQSIHGDDQGFNISYLDGHAKNRKENFEKDL